ncbi:Modulator of FtsH protease HflC [subsurface metagenome]
MQSERERIATKIRAEGREESAKIKAEANKQKEIIIAEAKRQADIIKGEGEAEAARIYGEAYENDVEFYKFFRTLQAYEKFLDEKTTIFIPADSELMRLLERGE